MHFKCWAWQQQFEFPMVMTVTTWMHSVQLLYVAILNVPLCFGCIAYVDCLSFLCKFIMLYNFLFRALSYSKISGLLDTGTVSGSKIIWEVCEIDVLIHSSYLCMCPQTAVCQSCLYYLVLYVWQSFRMWISSWQWIDCKLRLVHINDVWCW